MRITGWLALTALLPLMLGCGRHPPAPVAQAALGSHTPPTSAIVELSGKTQPVPGRVAKIAPVVLHPVTEVLVVPGTRVKKGQPLVRMDDNEAKADVRNKEAALKELCTSLKRFQAEPRQQEQEEAKANLDAVQVSARRPGATSGGLRKCGLKGPSPSSVFTRREHSSPRLKRTSGRPAPASSACATAHSN
jgi:multidrug efflux pump subunit AcrA (membrane-fusion protein)